MAHLRQNVWDLGDDWADPILWYARGVAAMKARRLSERTSWRFYAAMHGMDQPLWTQLGYLAGSDQLPTTSVRRTFWRQCQHGSWYFLPWHRGYLLAFEANVRAAVVQLGGPADWALPYWNYFKPNQFHLPPAFASPDWPDGQGDNPLFVPERYGPQNDGNVFVPIDLVNLGAMNDPDFTGTSGGGDPGFGGVDTGFQHSGPVHGGVETQPHDWVHGLVGGSDPQDPQRPGLMSDPDTAGLDPIFWLHHANIDRLWAVWRQNPASHVDPTDPNWVKGPSSFGERAFAMPMPDGSTWSYLPGEMEDLATLDYTYDDLAPAVAAVQPQQRLLRLGAAAAAPSEGDAVATAGAGGGSNVESNVELVGATQGPIDVTGSQVRSSVQLNSGMRRKVAASLTPAAAAEEIQPDRVFLNLENVRGLVDSTAFQVYVGVPDDADHADHPERLAGGVALFGVRKATLANGEHAGQGLTFVLDITDIVDGLHLDNALDVEALDVRIVPVRPVPDVAQVRIGRISIFRQGR
jgi:tyrosinase